jgi:hypothetical protein
MRNVVLSLTDKEFNTVLAGLRSWQKNLADTPNTDYNVLAIAEDDQGLCLSPVEIDELCERLNWMAGSPAASIDELLQDPSTPFWAIDTIRAAQRRDPVDAASVLEVLARTFSRRVEEMV